MWPPAEKCLGCLSSSGECADAEPHTLEAREQTLLLLELAVAAIRPRIGSLFLAMNILLYRGAFTSSQGRPWPRLINAGLGLGTRVSRQISAIEHFTHQCRGDGFQYLDV